MQQIEEIKRMSELAKQMRELGLAKNNSDAFNQARSVTSSDPAVAAQRKQDDLLERVAMLERKFESQNRSIEDLKAKLADEDKKFSDVLNKITSISAKLRDIETAATANLAPIPPPQAAQPWQQPAAQWQAPQQVQPQWQQSAPHAQPMPQSVQTPPWPQPAAQAPPPWPEARAQPTAQPPWAQGDMMSRAPNFPQPQEKPPSTQPIDRNGVAPSDVSVEKFFYFGNKR